MLNNNRKKKNNQFTILSNNSTDGHGGFGVGTITLNNVSPVIVDPVEEEAFVDMGALHARSAVEKRIRFRPDRSVAPNGKLYWLVWVTIDHKKEGPYYAGVTACEMIIDRETRYGYKNLADHVNKMDKSMKKQIIVEHMDTTSKKILAQFLKNHDADMWNRSASQLKEDLLSN